MSMNVYIYNDKLIAGELLSGEIVVEIQDEQKVESVDVKVRGKEIINSADYSSKHKFLVLQPKFTNTEHFQKGKNTIKFEAELPAHLCVNSFSIKLKNGYQIEVIYYLKVTIKTDKIEKLESSKIRFNVAEAFLSKYHPIHSQDTKTFMISKGTLKTSLGLPKQAYSVDESIPFRIGINNTTTKEINQVSLFLTRTLKIKKENNFLTFTGKLNKKELSLNIGGGEAISTEVELPLDTNILPSINGTTVSLQYQGFLSVGLKGVAGSEQIIHVPIILCEEKVLQNIPAPLEVSSIQEEAEFDIPKNAGEANELTELPLQSNVPQTHSVYYLKNILFYFNVFPSELKEEKSLFLHATSDAPISIKAKLNYSPAIFNYDIAATELPKINWFFLLRNGTLALAAGYTIKLNKYTSPPLKPGKWYFSVSGKGFMRDSNFTITCSLKSPQVISNAQQDDELETEVFEHLQENQKRSTLFSQYSEEGLQSPPPWMKIDGTPSPSKTNFPLPSEDWYWKSQWEVVKSKLTDGQGWSYSRNWSTPPRNENSATCYVRWRIWRRVRAIKTDEYRVKEEKEKEKEFENFIDEFEILETPKKKDPAPIPIVKDKPTQPKPQTPPVFKKEPSADSIKAPQQQRAEKLEQSSVLIEINLDSSDSDLLEKYLEIREANESPLDTPVNEVEEETKNEESDESGENTNEPLLDNQDEIHIVETEEEPEIEEIVSEPIPDFTFIPDTLRKQLSRSFIEEQEKMDEERRKREEEVFRKSEEERNKRAELLKQQREEEQRKMKEEWELREQQVKKQIEEDRKRLELLLESQNLLQAKTAKDLAKAESEIDTVVTKVPTVPIQAITIDVNEEELESMFEPLSDDEE